MKGRRFENSFFLSKSLYISQKIPVVHPKCSTIYFFPIFIGTWYSGFVQPKQPVGSSNIALILPVTLSLDNIKLLFVNLLAFLSHFTAIINLKCCKWENNDIMKKVILRRTELTLSTVIQLPWPLQLGLHPMPKSTSSSLTSLGFPGLHS